MSRRVRQKPPHVVTIDTVKLSAALRTARGEMSLRDYASALGIVAYSSLSRLENGDMPDLLTYVMLCDELSVPLDEFIIRWKVVKP